MLYPSCWTAGRSAHDPRRQHTRVSPTRHGAGAGARQHRQSLPRIRYLPDALPPLAAPLHGLRSGRVASPPPRATSGTSPAAQPPGRARDPGAGAGLADLGPGSAVRPIAPSRTRRPPGSTQYDLPAALPERPANALGAPGRARGAQRPGGGVLTDQGNEYRGAFDRVCAERRIRHTRTKPRHAWTNGFVERLQGTILSELWRIEFRRRFFTSAVAMQTALDHYLDFPGLPARAGYNHRRSHQGYRTRGRTPGEIFFTQGGKRDKRTRDQSVNTYPV